VYLLTFLHSKTGVKNINNSIQTNLWNDFQQPANLPAQEEQQKSSGGSHHRKSYSIKRGSKTFSEKMKMQIKKYSLANTKRNQRMQYALIGADFKNVISMARFAPEKSPLYYLLTS